VRRAPAIALVLGLLLAAAVPSATIASSSGRQAAVAPEWLPPAHLEELQGRLKRAETVVVPGDPPENGFRAPASAAELTEKANTWRTVAALPAPQTQQPTEQQPAPAASDPGSDYDAAVIAQTNTIRKAHGLPALQVSAKLTAAAGQHSASMGKSGYFAHESADGSAFWKRVEQYYPQGNAAYWAVGENIIYGSPDLTVPDAMTAWMESPGHRENLLSSDWREIGCVSVHLESAPGVYAGRKTVIITCDFGVRR
jgi:uncharacterized protein YkwD